MTVCWRLGRDTFITTILLMVAIIALAIPAAARGNQTKPNGPREKIVEARAYPWSAIAKLNNSVGGACTAVLVSRKLALTAAHCLYFAITQRFVPAQALHLILGYERDHFQEHLKVSAYYVPPGYDPARPYKTLANDWALLSIAGQTRMPTRSLNMRHRPVPSGAPTVTAGYSRRAPYVMTGDRNCKLIGNSRNHKYLLDSCATRGFSGAPVLVRDAIGNSYSIAGIHVANGLYQKNPVAVAIPADSIWRESRTCIEGDKCHFQFRATGRDPTAAELLSGLADVAAPSKPSSELSAARTAPLSLDPAN